MISREYPPFMVGGTGLHTFNLVKYLSSRGVEIKVLSFGDPGFSDDVVSFIKPRSSIISRRESSILSDLRVLGDILNITKKTKEMVNREHFDLIHVQEPYVGGLITHRYKVTTIHDTSFGEIKGYVKYISETQGLKRIVFYVAIGYWMEFLSIDNSRLIITPAYDVAWELIRVYKTPAWKIRIIQNGVERPGEDEPAREKARDILGISSDVFLVFTTGQHIGRKRLDILIYAAKYLRDMGIRDIRVVIGGEGPLTSYLKKLIVKYNLGEIVSLPGWIPSRQLHLYYRASDVFVVTSEYEAGPITMLEAGIRGCPLVVSDVNSGFMAIARDGVDCVKFRVNDPVDLSSKLKMIIYDPDLRSRLSRNAVEFASRFTWDKVAEKTIRVYREVVE